jgi:hypothetical protein
MTAPPPPPPAPASGRRPPPPIVAPSARPLRAALLAAASSIPGAPPDAAAALARALAPRAGDPGPYARLLTRTFASLDGPPPAPGALTLTQASSWDEVWGDKGRSEGAVEGRAPP